MPAGPGRYGKNMFHKGRTDCVCACMPEKRSCCTFKIYFMKKLYVFTLLILCCYYLPAQTWTGATSTDWNTASNWNPAGVPTSSGNVIIPGSLSNYPVMNGKVIINGIDMQSGSSLDVNGSELALNGVNTNINFIGCTLNNSNGLSDIVLSINTGTGGFYTNFRGNTINDHIVFNLSGGNNFIDGLADNGNTYNGNVAFNINDILSVYLSYLVQSRFNGNLNVNRTVAGPTNLFSAGAVITGNFSYTNNVGSGSALGNTAFKTSIGGTVNITAGYTTPGVFDMFRLENQITGGTISVLNSQGFNFQMDTLKLASLTVSGYRGNGYAYLVNNDITGNVTTADDASYSGGFYTYIRNNHITGNSNFTINGSNALLEGDEAGTGNSYEGNVVFNGAGGSLFIADGASLVCSGNLSINRTAPGHTQAFNSGATIGGNFSYTNLTAGGTYLGNVANKTAIAGTVTVQANYTTPNVFEMYRLVNQTGGGSISVQQSQGFVLTNDTLIVNAVEITGYKGFQYGYFLYNTITGNVSLTSDASYSNGFGTFIRSNVITGNSQFTINGNNFFNEGDELSTGNIYNGNLNFNAGGGSPLYISHLSPLQCSGNLSIGRTAAGHTQAFNSGAVIDGNFTYTNNTAGNTYLGNIYERTSIGGTVTINASYTSANEFMLHRFINQAAGGSINVQNSAGFNVQKDTLIVTGLSITGYRGNTHAYLLNNTISGNVTTADDASYTNGFTTVIRNNVITGNSSFSNNGSNLFAEGDEAGTGNVYNGNVSFNAAGGPLYIAWLDSLKCSGDLTINRTVAGITIAFNAGSSVSGNFTYTNNTSGETRLGSLVNRTSIGGQVSITAHYTSPHVFAVHRLINQAAGGTISVQNTTGFSFMNDTLKVTGISLTGYRGNAYGYFLKNDISGNVTTADDATYSGGFGTYIQNNIIEGNSSFTNNGSNNVFDADQAGTGNKYLGHLSYNRVNGSILAAIGAMNEVSGNLVLNSSANIGLGKIKFTGSTGTAVEQLGTQPILLAELIMEKTGTGNLTLNDPVSISTALTFTNGLINSSAGKELIFLDNAVYTGGSDACFVNGPVKKTGNDAFIFPVGKSTKLAPIGITAPAAGTDEFMAEYFMSPANNNGYDSSLKDPTIHHISSKEYWLLNRTAGTSAALVTVSWDGSRSGGVNNLPDLRVARWNGAMWKDEGNGGTTGNSTAGTIVTAAAINSFSPFTLASSTSLNPLPVKFVSFTAKLRDMNSIWLQWKTGQEGNSSFFEVQRSTSGMDWTSIAHIASNGSGSYEFTDYSVITGIVYYRIKQVDENGPFTYSMIIPVKTTAADQLRVWPVPAIDYIYVQTPEATGTMEVTDLNGRIMNRMVINNSITSIPVQWYANGIYIIRVRQHNETYTVKFLKQ